MKLKTMLEWLICVPGAIDEFTLTVMEKFTVVLAGSSNADEEIAPRKPANPIRNHSTN